MTTFDIIQNIKHNIWELKPEFKDNGNFSCRLDDYELRYYNELNWIYCKNIHDKVIYATQKLPREDIEQIKRELIKRCLKQ